MDVVKKGVYVFLYELVNEQLNYVLFKRAEGWVGWEVLKGGWESGETAEEAAVREVSEEAGIKVSVNKSELKDSFFSVKDGNKVRHDMSVFFADVNGGKIIVSEEHSDYIVVPLSEAVKLVPFDNVKDLLVKVDEGVRQHEKL